MRQVGVLISVYKPTLQLTQLVEELLHHDFIEIIIVDDGSPNEFRDFFYELQNKKNVTLLSHSVNLGKGDALKTGFNYFYSYHPTSIGIVTADADGQHLVRDILEVSNALMKDQKKIVLGCRQFDEEVPLRSRIGNLLSQMVFKVILGFHLSDTQTGLRGIPTPLLYNLLQLQTGHYEFEMDSLITSFKKGYKIIEVPVSTIYIGNNQSSHFNAVVDSLKIGLVFIKHMRDSFLTTLAEYGVFI